MIRLRDVVAVVVLEFLYIPIFLVLETALQVCDWVAMNPIKITFWPAASYMK